MQKGGWAIEPGRKGKSRARRAALFGVVGWIGAALTAFVGPAYAEGGSPAGLRLPTRLPGSSVIATFRIETWLKQEIPGGDYPAELVRAYQERASEEAGVSRKGKKNWYDATAFFAKAERVAQGEEAPPWSPVQLGLSHPLLIAAHRATVRRSIRYRGAAPDACAQMVALFDHWIEQQRDLGDRPPGGGRLFERWAEAFRACGAPAEIYGFPIGACANTDNDRRLADAPKPGLRERGKAEQLAEEIGAEEASGVLRLVGAEIVIEGHASATGAAAGAGTGTETGAGEKTLGVCRAVFVKQLLVVAGVDAARIAVEDKGASGAGEAYRHRRVVLRVE